MDLKHLDEAYANTSVDSKTGVDLPEGRYTMAVDNIQIFDSKEGRPFLKLTFRVVDGELTGMCVDKLYPLDNPERFRFLKSDLAVCGLICKLSEIPNEGKRIIGVRLQVQAKKNGQYTNYYLNGRQHAAAAEGAKADGVPF